MSASFNFRRTGFACLAIILVLGMAQQGRGQSTTGSIVGRVMDPSGAVVPKAHITATNQGTGVSYEDETNDAGDFAIFHLPPAIYNVTVTKQGFETATAKDFVLVIDQKAVLNFDLIVGAVSTVTTVTSELPLLQTQTVETGQVIESAQILDLPLLGRNFLDLARLTSGVTSGSGGNTLDLSVNGQREFANSVLIDGVEATGNRNNDTNLRPSVDAVQEFKVATSDYSAEYGRAAGGVISIQTEVGNE